MADSEQEVPPKGEEAATLPQGGEPKESQAQSGEEVLQWAIDRGFIPETEWKGDKDRYVPLQKWLTQYEESLPFIKNQRNKLERTVASLQGEIASTQQAMKSVVDHLRSDMDAKLQAKVSELEDQYAQAIADGSKEDIVRIGKQIRAVEKQNVPQPQAPQQPQQTPQYAVDWLGENQWYKDDKVARAIADTISNDLVAEGYNGKALLNEVTNRMKRERPQLFRGDNSNESPVESPTRSGRTSNVKYRLADVPREILDSFVGPESYKAWKTPQEYIDHLNKGN